MKHIAATTEITNKDVQLITGKRRTAALNLINKIRGEVGKTGEENITVLEFCNFKKYKLEDVFLRLNIKYNN